MRLLVIGCTGFLGGSVAQFWQRNGFEVLGIGRRERPAGMSMRCIAQNDFSNLCAVIRDFQPGVIMHAAGPASVAASFFDPAGDLESSVRTWAHTLDSVRRSGLQPLVIFPSSAAIYGNPAQQPVAENAPAAPISPYGFHKLACELLAREYSESFGVNIVICRFFSLFGPAQHRLLIWELYQQLDGPRLTAWLEGTGNESRDYLEIDNAMAAVFELVRNRLQTRPRTLPCRGETLVVNIASSEEVKVLDVAQRLRDLVAPEKRIRCRGIERRGDPRRWCADITRLRSLAPEWKPRPLSLALSECVSAWQGCRDLT